MNHPRGANGLGFATGLGAAGPIIQTFLRPAVFFGAAAFFAAVVIFAGRMSLAAAAATIGVAGAVATTGLTGAVATTGSTGAAARLRLLGTAWSIWAAASSVVSDSVALSDGLRMRPPVRAVSAIGNFEGPTQ